jgi:YcxB-like protein
MYGGSSGASPSGSGVIEIVQTRDITQPEAKQISRAAWRVIFQECRRSWLYWLFYAFTMAGFGAAVFAFIRFANLAACTGGQFPLWGKLAIVVTAGSYLAWRSQMLRVVAAGNREKIRAGNRYALTQDGITIDMVGMVTILPWRSIRSVSERAPLFLIHLSRVQVTVLPKAAFGGQDVDGFCAELERRWRKGTAGSHH